MQAECACSTELHRRHTTLSSSPPARRCGCHSHCVTAAMACLPRLRAPVLRWMASVPSIQLTREEGYLCTLLDDACRWMQASNPCVEVDGQRRTYAELCRTPTAPTSCEVRIAGGWVRDKLLGLPSHDLDVSLSSMTGYHFALFLKAYLESDRFPQTALAQDLQAHLPHGTISQIGKIAANPEQSKNLETATARVLGFDLDFVNLRKEVYEGTNRIPLMSFGTPLEDAMRRDITVNALFYNVHTSSVEDWTQHGLADLRDGIVRTPMDPASTFTDDPLRILRCVRFSSRFGYEVHEDIRACLCGTPASAAATADAATTAAPDARPLPGSEAHGGVAASLRTALTTKVSRERFGIEVDKMLSGRDPCRALDMLSELQLYKVVFVPPPPLAERAGKSSDGVHIDEPVADVPDERVALFLGACMADLMQAPAASPHAALWERVPADWLDALRSADAAPKRRLLWYAIALFPLRDIYVNMKKALVWAGALTISDGLKLGNRTTKDPVQCLARAAALLTRPALERFEPEPCLTRRSVIGLLLRQPCITQPALDVGLDNTLLFAMLCDLASAYDDASGTLDMARATCIVDEHAAFWAYVRDERLLAYAQAKPLVDGKRVAEALGCEMFVLGRVLPYVVAWQIDHDQDHDHDASVPVAERQAQCLADLQAAWHAGHMVPVPERTRRKAQ